METMTAAYSQQAMRTLLALDRRQRLLAVEAVEALTEQEATRRANALAEKADTAEQTDAPEDASGSTGASGNAGAGENADAYARDTSGQAAKPDETNSPAEPVASPDATAAAGQSAAGDTATKTETDADLRQDQKPEVDNSTADKNTAGKNTANTGNGIDMMPFGGNGEMHLVSYGDTGDLVVVIKDASITVMALIDVMQGLKKGAQDHE